MANIAGKVAQIRQAIFGKDVRENIASGIEAINAEVESTTQRQDVVDEAEVEREAAEAIRQANEDDRVEEHALRMNEVESIKDAYDAATKANLSVEVSNARTSAVKSKTFGTLKERLEESEQDLATYKAENAAQLALKVDKIAGKGLSTNDFTNDDKAQIGSITNKADKSYVDSQIQAVASGSPKAVFATLAALQADGIANTVDGKKYIYLVTTDGKWYYWNGTSWTSGGIYQSTGIADKSITDIALSDMLRNRQRPQIRQGIDPAYESERPWTIPTNHGTGSSEWKTNAGDFTEGTNYLKIIEGDIDLRISFYIDLNVLFRGATSKKVRYEITYKSNANASFINYQSDVKKTSGLYSGGSISLPNTSMEEKTVEFVGNIYAADVRYLKPTVNVETGGTLMVGSVKCSILADSPSITMEIPEGVHEVSGMAISDTPAIYGKGKGSKLKSNADAILLTLSDSETEIKDLQLEGTNNAAYTSEKGISTTGKEFLTFSRLRFKNFKGGSGLYVGNTYANHDTLTAETLHFINNNIGLNLEERAEYCGFTGCHFNGNAIAARVRGGNNTFSNCFFTNNVDGIHLLAGENDSHGIISGCQINHNTGKAIYIDGIGSGETIMGCHIYNGEIHLKDTNGRIRFSNCVISPDFLKIENCGNVYFFNCYFSGILPEDVTITNSTIRGRDNIFVSTNQELAVIFNTL